MLYQLLSLVQELHESILNVYSGRDIHWASVNLGHGKLQNQHPEERFADASGLPIDHGDTIDKHKLLGDRQDGLSDQ